MTEINPIVEVECVNCHEEYTIPLCMLYSGVFFCYCGCGQFIKKELEQVKW